MSLAEQACRLNVPVFPCDARKRPIVAGGFKAASADPDTIRHMFAGDSAVMVGMPTGPASGMFVVDVDVKGAARGMEWLDSVAEALPPTRRHRTASGGLHLFWRWPGGVRNSAGKVAPGVDVRGEGGYVVVPPSPGYSVEVGGPPVEAPGWLLAAIRRPRAIAGAEPILRGTGRLEERLRVRVAAALSRVAGAGEGTRNDALNREAFVLGMLVRDGFVPREFVRGELWWAARHAGLGDAEIRATLNSAFAAVLA